MKRTIFRLIAICVALVFTFACNRDRQIPAWLEGKWIEEGDVAFEFQDTNLTMYYHHKTINYGGFIIKQDGNVLVENTPVGIKVDMENQSLFDTETNQALLLSSSDKFPEEYSWIKGKWKNSSMAISLNKTRIKVKVDGKEVNAGNYVIKDNKLVVLWEREYKMYGSFELNPEKQSISYLGKELKK